MRRFLKKLRMLRSEMHILYLAFRHPHTPPAAKLLIGLIAVYILSPVDLVPDFIPMFGYLDELILVPLLFGFAYRLVPAPVLQDCRQQALKHPLNQKLRLWTGAFIVLMILLVLTLYAFHWYTSQSK